MPAAFAAPAKAESAGAGQEAGSETTVDGIRFDDLKKWSDIQNVKVEVDGRESETQVTLKSGPVKDMGPQSLPENFPHRDKLQLEEVFVDIDGQRFAVDFVGGYEGKTYYALKGADMDTDMLVTSVVNAPKTVVLSYTDTTKPLKVSVTMDGGSDMKERDNYTVIGLTEQELSAFDGTKTGSFDITHGASRSFVVEKQVAQQIEISSTSGKVTKISGDDIKDPVQVWQYEAPKDGETDAITIKAKGLKRTFKVKTTVPMPFETPGGGDGKPNTNRMFGDVEVAGYSVDGFARPRDWDNGGEKDYFKYYESADQGAPDVSLTNGRKLSVGDREFMLVRGEHWFDKAGNTLQGVVLSKDMDVTFDRNRGPETTVLIDMNSTRCTPGPQGWATQMSGVTVNGVAIPMEGFDFTTVGGPNGGDELVEKVSDWVTLGGEAKGTQARVIALGSWTYHKTNLLAKWEFHHYMVELRGVTGPVEVKAIYTTTANFRVIDLEEYGVDAQIYRKDESSGGRYWDDLEVGETLQIKNMVTTGGKENASDLRVFADSGYTLRGAEVKQVDDEGEVVVVPLTKTEFVDAKKKNANVYEIEAPSPSGKMGYSYFFMEGKLVDYGISYDPNGGTYVEHPSDGRPYNVEALSSLTVEPQRPVKVDEEGTWTFSGYSLYDESTPRAAQALKSGIQPGQSVDLSQIDFGDSNTDKRNLVLRADWQSPASRGQTVKAKVNFDLYDPYGKKEQTVERNALLAKNTDYEFVSLSDTFENSGHTYHLNKEKSSLDNGKATANGQVIGTAVYERKDADKPGTLDGSKYLHGKKVVKGEGASLAKGQFEFRLTALVKDAPMPKEGATTTNDADGTFKFGNIEFTKPGTYLYEISEVDKQAEHWTYDTHKLRVTVTAMPPARPGEALQVTATAEESARTFVNTYSKPKPQAVTLDGKTYLDGTKALTGEGAPKLEQDKFQFAISSVSAPAGVTAPMPQQHSVLNAADGRFYFDDIVFNAPGTYVYEIAEDAQADPQFIYDGTRYKVTVTVTEPTTPGGMYGLKFEGPDSLDFVNTFVKAPDFRPGVLEAGSIAGVKILYGAELDAGDFGFKIAAQNGAPLPTRTVERNFYDGDYAFGPIVFTKPGTYVYTVSEVNEGIEGYTYDGHAATVTVEVADDPAQQDEPLTCKVVKVDGSLEFVNTYAEPTPDPGVLKGIVGTVALTGEGAPALKGGEFRFTMLPVSAPDGAQVPAPAEAVNAADGSFAFGDLSFDTPGVYEYRVTQVEGRDPRVTYDTHEAVVTVTVSEPASAQSVDAAANPSYTVDAVVEGSLEFENQFTLPAPPAPPAPPVEPETPEQPQAPEAAPEQPVVPERPAAPDAKPAEGAITQTNDAFGLVVPMLAGLAAMSLAAGLVALLLCSGRGRMRR